MGSSSEILTPSDVIPVTLANSSTEYSQALPAGCKHFSIQERSGLVAVLFAFSTGQVAGGTNYATIQAGKSYTSPEKLCFSGAAPTLYFASGTANTVVEIVAWT